MSKQTHRRVRNILTLWEEFDLQNPEGTPTDFGNWLLAKDNNQDTVNEYFEQFPAKMPSNRFDAMYADFDTNYPVQVRISIAITRIWRVVKNQIKHVLTPIGMPNVDDFYYLASLYSMNHPTKSELISWHMHEITTGTEVIKRLLNNGWIEEFPHPNDKRAKLLRLTSSGISQIELGFESAIGVSMNAYSILDKDALKKLRDLLVIIELENTKHLFTPQIES